MKFSLQQDTFFDWVTTGRGSAILVAVAGAGKSTAIREACKRIGDRASVAVLAFNKKIADEMGAGLKDAGCGRNVQAGTFHSFGLRAWRKVAPNVKVEPKKLANIAADLKCPEELVAFVLELVSLAKQRGIGVLERMDDQGSWYRIVEHYELEDKLSEDGSVSEENLAELLHSGLQWGYKVLKRSIELDREMVDYDDMIFAPLVHNVKMWQNDWVFIDEAQDTNPARRALAKKMLRTGGRLVAVGDPRQAIYGFTGADNDALDIIAREFTCSELPLTVTFRCPKAVVSHARHWVSHITAADSAPEGSVSNVAMDEFLTTLTDLQPTDAILCRNTKPLVELAFTMIRARVACHVEGKEIGQGLMALARKWKSVKTIGTLRSRLSDYLTRETEKLMAKGGEVKAAALADRVGTLMVIMESLADDEKVDAIQKIINDLFQDSNGGQARSVTLSTVHKSKGREWDRVFLLGRNRYMPSPFARQDWQVEQEDNLIYVAVTRAKQDLVEIEVPFTPKKRAA